MGTLEKTIALEGIKALMQLVFQLQRQGALTADEMDQAFEQSRQDVATRPGGELADV